MEALIVWLTSGLIALVIFKFTEEKMTRRDAAIIICAGFLALAIPLSGFLAFGIERIFTKEFWDKEI